MIHVALLVEFIVNQNIIETRSVYFILFYSLLHELYTIIYYYIDAIYIYIISILYIYRPIYVGHEFRNFLTMIMLDR